MPDTDPATKSMDAIVALCKRRGFVYPASEIYGGINGFWDYGPLGTALKNNIRDHWWKQTVECPPIGPDGEPVSIVGLDSSIIQNPKTWEASGHVGGFNDPRVDDTVTKQRFRADHLYGLFIADGDDTHIENLIASEQAGTTETIFFPLKTVVASGAGEALQQLQSDKKLLRPIKELNPYGNPAGNPIEKGRCINKDGEERRFYIMALSLDYLTRYASKIPSPATQEIGTLTEPKQFNLMFESETGAVSGETMKVYLRPETAQGIFLNYKNVLDTMRVKVPFGIAQVGKSFRNEVTPRNFIFRSREFEQMEMEWFCAPDDSPKWYDFWKHERMRWWESLGVSKSNLRYRDHDPDELAHYSKMCVDIEYKYPFSAPGYGELEGVAHRGCYDLNAHTRGTVNDKSGWKNEFSNAKMEYLDQERQIKAREAGLSKDEINAQCKYIPNVIEPASGLTRGVLVLLCEAYTPDETRPSKVYMKFKPKFAPIKAGIFPLVNKDGMPEVAKKLYMGLREKFACQYDAKQAIGKRYARMDEVGTPYCFTIDGDTLADQTVTVRDRDSQSQERISLDKVESFLAEKIGE
jgi:glycyl-tRNA synthetase